MTNTVPYFNNADHSEQGATAGVNQVLMSDSSGVPTWSAPLYGNGNVLINPFMEIDQANEGAAVTASGSYIVDGWKAGTTGTSSFQRASDGPLRLPNSLKITTTTGASVAAGTVLYVLQPIEANTVSDWAFGTAGAQTLALSFWVKSSIASYVMSVALQNATGTRSYTANVTVNAANTWEQKTVVIPGDTGGTWVMNGITAAANLFYSAAAGSTFQTAAGAWATGNFIGTSSNTNTVFSTTGAALQITGAKLEAGPAATPLRRLSFGEELLRCQRYYRKSYTTGAAPGSITNAGMLYRIDFGYNSGIHTISFLTQFAPSMRTSPTVTWYSPVTGASGKAADFQSAADTVASNQVAVENEIVGSAQQTAASTSVQVGVQFTADARL